MNEKRPSDKILMATVVALAVLWQVTLCILVAKALGRQARRAVG